MRSCPKVASLYTAISILGKKRAIDDHDLELNSIKELVAKI